MKRARAAQRGGHGEAPVKLYSLRISTCGSAKVMPVSAPEADLKRPGPRQARPSRRPMHAQYAVWQSPLDVRQRHVRRRSASRSRQKRIAASPRRRFLLLHEQDELARRGRCEHGCQDQSWNREEDRDAVGAVSHLPGPGVGAEQQHRHKTRYDRQGQEKGRSIVVEEGRAAGACERRSPRRPPAPKTMFGGTLMPRRSASA